jgi:hypothetical protein
VYLYCSRKKRCTSQTRPLDIRWYHGISITTHKTANAYPNARYRKPRAFVWHWYKYVNRIS